MKKVYKNIFILAVAVGMIIPATPFSANAVLDLDALEAKAELTSGLGEQKIVLDKMIETFRDHVNEFHGYGIRLDYHLSRFGKKFKGSVPNFLATLNEWVSDSAGDPGQKKLKAYRKAKREVLNGHAVLLEEFEAIQEKVAAYNEAATVAGSEEYTSWDDIFSGGGVGWEKPLAKLMEKNGLQKMEHDGEQVFSLGDMTQHKVLLQAGIPDDGVSDIDGTELASDLAEQGLTLQDLFLSDDREVAAPAASTEAAGPTCDVTGHAAVIQQAEEQKPSKFLRGVAIFMGITGLVLAKQEKDWARRTQNVLTADINQRRANGESTIYQERARLSIFPRWEVAAGLLQGAIDLAQEAEAPRATTPAEVQAINVNSALERLIQLEMLKARNLTAGGNGQSSVDVQATKHQEVVIKRQNELSQALSNWSDVQKNAPSMTDGLLDTFRAIQQQNKTMQATIQQNLEISSTIVRDAKVKLAEMNAIDKMIDEFSKVRAQTIEAVDNAGAAIDSDGGEVIRYRYDASQRASSQSNGRGFGPGQ